MLTADHEHEVSERHGPVNCCNVFQLSKKYGPVFTVYLGPQRVVVLTGFKAVREALVTNSEVFGERSVPMIFQMIAHNNGTNNILV